MQVWGQHGHSMDRIGAHLMLCELLVLVCLRKYLSQIDRLRIVPWCNDGHCGRAGVVDMLISFVNHLLGLCLLDL